jgi:F0F1-type ATP synthase delta subunit
MDEQDKLKELQKNLAKDLVQLESYKLLTDQQLEKITDAYSKVYDILIKINNSIR